MNTPRLDTGIRMPHRYLTVHTLTALPWHNLNRDENGAPKQVTEGGVTRARLSSQSLKRAARIGFERAVEDELASTRTKVAVSLILDRIAEIRGDLSAPARKKLTTSITGRLKELTHAADSTSAKETLIWLSAGELEAVAQAFAVDDDGAPVLSATSTDSLAIAAFGRMFAAAPHLNVPASVSVGDSVTTHEAAIELDWFASVDDAETRHAGAGQLGFTMQTNGVYYRSFTLDRDQLARNWDVDLNTDAAQKQLAVFLRHLTLALPTGRNAGTAAQVLPSLIIAEEQAHRVAYSFHEPVTTTDGGYLDASIQALLNRAADARAFDPDLFGATFYTGTDAARHLPNVTTGDFSGYIRFVIDHLRAA